MIGAANRKTLLWVGALLLLVPLVALWFSNRWQTQQNLLNDARRQQQILKQLRQAGVDVYSDVSYDPDGPTAGFGIGGGGQTTAPDWVKKALDDNEFYEARLTCVGRTRRAYSPADWAEFAALRELRAVSDSGEAVDDGAIAALAAASGVEFLSCNGAVSDRGLSDLAAMPSLRILAINRPTGITRSGIAGLAALPNLERLQILDWDGSSQDALEVAALFPRLRRLELYVPRMRQKDIEELRAQLPNTIVNAGSPSSTVASSPASP